MLMNNFVLAWARLDDRTGHDLGRKLLSELYYAETGKEMPEIRIAEGGKPFFANSKYHFSISHTKQHAFCALSRHPIGIDAEEKDREIKPRLAEKILSEAEKQRYDASSDKHTCLLRLWVLKEASVKLTGRGLRGYPNHTDFDPNDPRVTEIDGCYVAVLEEDYAF